IYKGRRYIITTPINEAFPRSPTITTDVDWLSLKESIGFNERNGVVNIGYYPVKVTEKTFEDLRVDNKILRCGNVIAIIEYSYGVTVGDHLYTFNDHIVRKLRDIDMTRRVVEVNPFYIEPRPEDLVRIVNYLLSTGEVYVKTYEGDPVANRLPLTGRTGALVMEYEKRNFSSV
ncbi:MAG: hypothetical protein QXN67_10625, partial [Thermoproteota archaeon]